MHGRNLTLTLSLRAEHHSNPTCRRRCFTRPAAPFDSVSYDPDQPYNQAILINQKHALTGIDTSYGRRESVSPGSHLAFRTAWCCGAGSVSSMTLCRRPRHSVFQ